MAEPDRTGTATRAPYVLELDPASPPSFETGEITFIETATVLRYAGFTILTDPNFVHRGHRAYVGLGLSTRRLTEPAMGISTRPDEETARGQKPLVGTGF